MDGWVNGWSQPISTGRKAIQGALSGLSHVFDKNDSLYDSCRGNLLEVKLGYFNLHVVKNHFVFVR